MTHGHATFPLSELVAGVQLCMRSAVQSDGYLSGLGQSLWTNSGCFERQRDLIETACGQMAFVDPLTGEVQWKNADYFEESVGDCLEASLIDEDEDGSPEAAPLFAEGPFAGVCRAELLGWAAQMAQGGEVPEKFAKRLRSIPIQERFDEPAQACGIVEYDGKIVNSARAIPDGGKALIGAQAARWLADMQSSDPDLSFFGCARYAWDRGRWMTAIEDDGVDGVWIPVSMALAHHLAQPCSWTRMIDAYLEAGITPQDMLDLDAMAAEVGWAKVFAGVPSVQAFGARRQIEAHVPLAGPSAAAALRV